jgi:PncC family amidohydrolase
MLTDVPGSSKWYLGGVVAYANAVKVGLLGVSGETLRRSGAVSAHTVREMARGICHELGSSVGLAVSGVAGPGGGTRRKPVGLVYLAVCCGGRVKTRKCSFVGNRRAIKRSAAKEALSLCLKLMEECQ